MDFVLDTVISCFAFIISIMLKPCIFYTTVVFKIELFVQLFFTSRRKESREPNNIHWETKLSPDKQILRYPRPAVVIRYISFNVSRLFSENPWNFGHSLRRLISDSSGFQIRLLLLLPFFFRCRPFWDLTSQWLMECCEG